MASLEDAEETLNLHGSMDPALLPDITTTYEHMQRSDGSVGLVEKANSGRMSPIRKRSVKDTKQQIETLEKENFDLKLRIYFLENQKGINKDDTLKVNIDLRVQLQSFHQEFQRKQDTWEQMMTGYENHIEELEQRLQTDQSTDLVRDYESLKLKLATVELSLQEMEQLLNDKAFESQGQLQSANQEIEKLKEQLADRERQLITSPTQEELLELKHSLSERESALEDKDLLLSTYSQQVKDLETQLKQVIAKLSMTSNDLSEKEKELSARDSELNEKDQELRAVRDELTQRDFSLRKAQIDLQLTESQALGSSKAGTEIELEKYRAELAEKFHIDTQSMASELHTAQKLVAYRDAELAAKDKEFKSLEKKLTERDESIGCMNDEINRQRQQMAMLSQSVTDLKSALRDKERQLEEARQHLQLNADKFSKDVANLEQQMVNLQNIINSKDMEIESLKGDRLTKLEAELLEKDRQISSYVESYRQQENLIEELKAAAENGEDKPDCTSTPREEVCSPAITHLCMEVERLKKENAALKEGRPLDYSGSDLEIDIDGLSDSSDNRDYLHTQLAKSNARAQALQAKILEMSREDIDGGSEASSVLREQVAALMRMRESDQRVIEALKKHIAVNSDSEFNPEVINELSTSVHMLTAKVKELQKKNRKYQKSHSSRSTRSSSSGGGSVYREEIDHLKRELDVTRHEASKVRSELNRLSDESAIVTKLLSTEALVRQQADEKKSLEAELEYYKGLLAAAGLLPSSPFARRESAAERSKRSSSEKETDESPRDANIEDRIRGMMFRQQKLRPEMVKDTMQKLAGNIPAISQSAPSSHSRIPTVSQSAAATSMAEKQAGTSEMVEEDYCEEVREYGRPADLRKKIAELAGELEDTQDRLNQSVEYNQQLEHTYGTKLEEKDDYIEELEEKIRQLEAQLRGFYTDRSGSITLELVGSRPPSSLHSVPVERTSSRVVTLNDSGPHDRSTSGVAVDRSTLTFSGSTHRPGSISPLENVPRTSLNKSAESGISQGVSAPSTSRSHLAPQPSTHDDADLHLSAEISPVVAGQQLAAKVLSPLHEVSPAFSRESLASDRYQRDSGLETSQPSKRDRGDDETRSVTSLLDTLDGTTERMRKSNSLRYNEPPSLGASLLPGEALRTQENLLNVSSENIHKMAAEPHVKRAFASDVATSPEKGRVHSPTISSQSQVLISPVKNSGKDQSTERYEKQTSPNRQLLERAQANSWEQAADQAFPSQSGKPADAEHRGVRGSAVRPSSASLVDLDTLSNEGVLYERPLSAASASTQTDADDMVELSKKLVMALSREDSLKEQRRHLGDLHRQYEEALKASQEENEEIRSRLSEADADLDNQIQKRLETAEMANTLQRQLSKKDAELKQSNQAVSKLKERLSRSKSDLSASQDELSSTRQELNSANQNLIDSSKKFKETAKQLREVKDHLHKVQEEHRKSLSELQQTTSSLKEKDRQTEMAQAEVSSIRKSFSKAEDELRASQTELRIAKEELARKTDSQVELTKRLSQLESEREAVLRRHETLPFPAQELQAPPVVSADYDDRLQDTPEGSVRDRASSLRRPSSIAALQEELGSILDASQHIKSNIASALEQSRLHDTLMAGVPIQPVHSQSLPLSVKHEVSTPSFQAHHSKQPISFSDQLNTSGNNATERSLPDYNIAEPMARNSYMLSHDVSAGQVSQSAPELVTINGVTYQQVPSSRVPPASSTQLPVTSGSLIVPEFQSFQQAPATGCQQAPATTEFFESPTIHQQAPAGPHQQTLYATGSSLQLPSPANQQTRSYLSNSKTSPETNNQCSPVTAGSQPHLPSAVSQQAPASTNPYGQSLALGHQQANTDTSQQPPKGNSQQSPATGYKQTNATGYQKSPATGYQQSPVTGYHQAPATGYHQAPATDYQRSPATGNQQTPVSGQQYSPVVGYQQAPVSGQQYSSIVDSQQAPVSVYQQAPAASFQQTPTSGYQQAAVGKNIFQNSCADGKDYSQDAGKGGKTAADTGYSAMLPYKQGQLGKVTQPPIYTSTPVLEQVAEPRRLAPTQQARSQSGEGQPRESQSGERQRGSSQSEERQHERSQSRERQPRESQSGERQRGSSQSGDPVYEVLVTSNRQPRKSYIGSGKELTSPESSGSRLAAGISPDTSPPSAYLTRPADLYNSTQPSFPHLQEQRLSNLPPAEELPSTRGPLYAVSDLINYELLKKQNEESLTILSGLEARIQGRLDRFTAASPLEDMEWCTLKELKACADNLRHTLFAEKKHITMFYIRELPDNKGPKYEEMLRAYKMLESRYQWAKGQLMELMKATKLDEDLVAQMKRVKSILKASKENIKAKSYTATALKQKLV